MIRHVHALSADSCGPPHLVTQTFFQPRVVVIEDKKYK